MQSRSIKRLATRFDLRLELPGSKSFANRAIVCAALSNAPCKVSNVSPGDDTALMLNVLGDLGWGVVRTNPLSTDIALTPPAKPYAPPRAIEIFTGAAGTATRFAAALLTCTPGRFLLDANARMRERPMGELIAALWQLGAKIDERGEPGCVPLAIEGASLRGGSCRLRGDVSSQFLSALLMVAPVCSKGLEIEIEGELVSRPYIELTLEVMSRFGIPDQVIQRDGDRRFSIKPCPYSGTEYTCPPDATAAGYFWGAAAVTASRCVVGGLSLDDLQGDVALALLLGQMGCEVLELPDGLGVDATGVGELKPIQADLSALPDSAQTLAVVCAFAEGTSRLTGLSTLRRKETNRIAALQAELAKLGVETRAGEDWLEIDGRREGHTSAAISTYDDHRMAMSFAIAGLRVAGIEIEDPNCVSKSFPGFWAQWEKLT